MGFAIVAMTIIGLPYDTEESIMKMADWVTKVSKYQTANLLTPLPATSNWTDLVPLDADGNILAEGQMRPYHLYTGRQLVYQDERWTMEESRQLFNRYHDQLTPVDRLYERMFRLMNSPRLNLADTGKDLTGTICARINEFSETLKTVLDSSKELPEAISHRMHEVSETLGRYRDQLTATGKEIPDVIATQANEATETVKKYRLQIGNTGRELSEGIHARINDASEALSRLAEGSRKPVSRRE